MKREQTYITLNYTNQKIKKTTTKDYIYTSVKRANAKF